MYTHISMCALFLVPVRLIFAELQVRYEYIQDFGRVPNDVKFLCGVAYSSSHEYIAVMVNETSLECSGLKHEWGLSPSYMPWIMYMVKMHTRDKLSTPAPIEYSGPSGNIYTTIPVMFNQGATISVSLMLSGNWGQFVIHLNYESKTKPLRMSVHQEQNWTKFYHVHNSTKGDVQIRHGVEPFVSDELLTVTFVAEQYCIRVLVNGADYYCYNHELPANLVDYMVMFRGGNYTGTVDLYGTEMYSQFRQEMSIFGML